MIVYVVYIYSIDMFLRLDEEMDVSVLGAKTIYAFSIKSYKTF